MDAAPAYDYKYTDRDVREDPRLGDLAKAYLLTYGGEFEPLREAQSALLEFGNLTTPMIRKVLNCMRHDHHVASAMPRPARPSFGIEDIKAFRNTQQQVQQPRLRLVEDDEEERVNYPFDLKVKWKGEYIAATHKRAFVFHLLNPTGSSIHYVPAWDWEKRFQVRLRTYCAANPTTGVLLVEQPANRKPCKTCYTLRDEQRAREEARAVEAERLREGN